MQLINLGANMKRLVKTKLKAAIHPSTYILLPVMQIALVLRSVCRKENESPTDAHLGGLADLKMKNVIITLVISYAVFGLAALRRHIAMTKLKQIPPTSNQQGDLYA